MNRNEVIDGIVDLEKKAISTRDNYFKWVKKDVWEFYKGWIIYSVIYAISVYFYLSIYERVGFERTIIIMLVGVVMFAIRANFMPKYPEKKKVEE